MTKRQMRDKEDGLIYKVRTNIAYRRKFLLSLSVFWSYVILGWSVLQIGTALPDIQRLVRVDLETASWIFTVYSIGFVVVLIKELLNQDPRKTWFMGWSVLQIGTALPDIQRLVRVDLETASWIFTVYSIGFVVGSLVSGRLYDRHNRLVIMMVNSVLLSASICCVPYCRAIAILLVIRLFSGFFAGSIDTGANTIVPTIWDSKEGQPFMQAMYLTYTLGGIFSPLATKPFMAQTYGINNVGEENYAKPESFIPYNRSTAFSLPEFSDRRAYIATNLTIKNLLTNASMVDATVSFFNYSTSNGADISEQNQTNPDSLEYNEETKIYLAFIMTGVIVLSSAFPYLIMRILGNYDKRAGNEEGGLNPEAEKLKEKTGDSEKRPKVSRGSKIILLALVAGINFTYSAIEDNLGAFMTTYCLFYLHWTKSDSVLLMSMYWVASCVGGCLGIFVIKLIGPAKLLCLAFSVWNTSFIVSVIGNITKHAILTWIGFLGAGSAMVLVIPAIISWTNDNVCEITGKVSSIFMISTGVGIAVNPKFIGYMMEEFSYGNLVYILTGETLVCTIFFCCAIIIYNCCNKHSVSASEMDGGVTNTKV